MRQQRKVAKQQAAMERCVIGGCEWGVKKVRLMQRTSDFASTKQLQLG
jgi:hypothetical protein